MVSVEDMKKVMKRCWEEYMCRWSNMAEDGDIIVINIEVRAIRERKNKSRYWTCRENILKRCKKKEEREDRRMFWLL